VWPQDPGFQTALAGGVTTLQVLPGSANLIGAAASRCAIARHDHAGHEVPGAPHGLKMACGENPKRVYGGMGRAPSTAWATSRLPAGLRRRAGLPAPEREVSARTRRLRGRQFRQFRQVRQPPQGRRRRQAPVPPKRDLRLETLVARWPARSRCTCTAIAPTRWPSCSTRARVRLQGRGLPPRGRGLQDRRPPRRRGRVRCAVGGLVGLQARGYDAIWENLAFVDAPDKAARSCTPTPRKASSASTRKRPRPWCAGNAPGSTSRRARDPLVTSNAARSLGIEGQVARSNPAGSPTSWSGTATLQRVRTRRAGLRGRRARS